MLQAVKQTAADTLFESINAGFNKTFQASKLTLGLVVPIENYGHSSVPTMQQHIERVQLAESLGFSAVWLRDVPFDVPSFGDAGQTFDPFVYLGALAASTSDISLGVSSIILPLRHPLHVAKSATSADVLSNGRLILGVASGDRPEEYPAMNFNFHNRSEGFREAFEYIRNMDKENAVFTNEYGQLNGNINMLPKPSASKLPLFVTGGSQQHPRWVAEHADGWMTYPRDIRVQSQVITDWQTRVSTFSEFGKPVMQPLYVDLVKDDNAPMQPIHLGFRAGIQPLKRYLRALQEIGVNHVALNLRFNQADIQETLHKLSTQLLPEV